MGLTMAALAVCASRLQIDMHIHDKHRGTDTDGCYGSLALWLLHDSVTKPIFTSYLDLPLLAVLVD
jgi:hypothetical protein